LIELVLKAKKQGKKALLVGHGVGAWISFVVAQLRPDLVTGIVGMSADPDFTEELLWKKLPEHVKNKIMEDGVYEIEWGEDKYPISRNLIEDGRSNLLLSGGPQSLKISCPVRLIHSISDKEVPYEFAMKLVENCQTQDAMLTLAKNSNHNFETEADMKCMRAAIQDVLESYQPGQWDLSSPGSG
jgi:pimeloyl-ACP methyl ester carboxylesterase